MPAERVRTTVSVDPEVLNVFRVMAEAGGISLSRCLGDWLADTAEGAQLVAAKMHEARAAPMTVMRELQASLQGVSDDVLRTMDRIRSGELRPRESRQARGRPGRGKAPASNTGLKSPRKGRGRP